MPGGGRTKRSYSGSHMTRKGGANGAGGTAGSIRLRSGSAGHKPLDDEEDDHEPIQVKIYLLYYNKYLVEISPTSYH